MIVLEDISKDQSYRLEIAPPLLLSECAVEAWHEGHQIWHEKLNMHVRRLNQIASRKKLVLTIQGYSENMTGNIIGSWRNWIRGNPNNRGMLKININIICGGKYAK
jgi:hypothetical protein